MRPGQLNVGILPAPGVPPLCKTAHVHVLLRTCISTLGQLFRNEPVHLTNSSGKTPQKTKNSFRNTYKNQNCSFLIRSGGLAHSLAKDSALRNGVFQGAIDAGMRQRRAEQRAGGRMRW